MSKLTQPKVFFSYSWKDQAIAMRIYYDLTRSGVSVWRDKINASKTEFHFLESIYQEIDNVDYFILLDSPYSRKSFFVQKEVTYFRKISAESDAKKMIICLVEKKEDTHNVEEIFLGQNFINFFDFSGIKIYDTHKKFRRCIEELILTLGGVFAPWPEVPNEKDFEDEISKDRIIDEDRQSLLSSYRSFIWHYSRGSYFLIDRIKIIIHDCENLGVKALAPYLSLVRLHVEFSMENGGFSKEILEAERILYNLVEVFPEDPRVWQGLGYVNFCQRKYLKSINQYTKAIQVCEVSGNINFINYIPSLREQKGEVLLKAGRFTQALEIFRELYEEALTHNILRPSHYTNLAFSYAVLGELPKRQFYLDEGLKEFPYDASILVERSAFLLETGAYYEALRELRTAVLYNPKNINALASFCILSYQLEEYSQFQQIRDQLFQLRPQNGNDYYLMGRVFFISGNNQKAIACFNKSEGVGPYYDEL